MAPGLTALKVKAPPVPEVVVRVWVPLVVVLVSVTVSPTTELPSLALTEPVTVRSRGAGGSG